MGEGTRSPAPTPDEALELVAPLTIPYGLRAQVRHGRPDRRPADHRASRRRGPARADRAAPPYRRPFAIARVEGPAFDRLLSDAYAMDGQATAIAAVGMGDELDMLADGIPTAEDLLDTADDAPAIRLINGIIADAARNGVSDIHIEPYETGLVVGCASTASCARRCACRRMSRRGGQPYQGHGRLDIAERRVPQDGRMALTLGGKLLDVRVSTLPPGGRTRGAAYPRQGECGHRPRRAGHEPAMYALLREALSEPNGIILVTGPTGSGKTTSLYAALRLLNDGSRNILTVEDPVEYAVEGVGPDPGQRQGRPDLRGRACARSCARTRTW